MQAEFFEHITSKGDRWDTIAFTYYGDAKQMSPLLMANPDILLAAAGAPLIFDAGVTVRVPVLDGDTPDTDLPPWRST